MNTSPLQFGTPTLGVTRANNYSAPPGSTHGVQPQDTVAEGFSAPPVTYTAPAAETPARKGPSRMLLGVLGLTVALGVGVATLGPALSGGAHQGSKPAAAVTIQKDTARADLKTEVQRAQYGVALQGSRVDTTLSASGNFGTSAEYAAIQPVQERTEANGYSFTVNAQQLVARGGVDDVVVLDTREGQIPQYVQAFQQEGAANWTYNTTTRAAGGAGTFASVAVTSDIYTGGSPNQSAELMTFDHVEGKRVMLNEVLNPQQQAHVLNSVRTGLNAVPAGSLFQHDNLGEIVNRSFAIRDEGGQELKLVVAVPGNSEANEGRVAEFTFSIPRDVLK